LARADVVVDNSGDLDALRRRVEEVWAWIGDLRRSLS
jgi:dephospho-CoA kinase